MYGGYDYDFVDKISERFNCNICTKVLRNPHLAVCCGQHFCESCLNEWFTRQGKESCPHCRAEGEGFNHVIHKGVRSEINQLKIKCINHGEGCQWTGELGGLKQHLESDNGCDFVVVECPSKCVEFDGLMDLVVKTMRRRDLANHLAHSCYLRPYQCKFCGLKDTYEAITGNNFQVCLGLGDDDYFGHQAKCPEAPLKCPNKCGMKNIKRKDMEDHRSLCPWEPVECPFAEAGCRVDIRRHHLKNHMTASLQQHLMLLMIDRTQMKTELKEMKAKLHKAETERDKFEVKLRETEDRLAFCEAFGNPVNKLKKSGDSMKLTMHSFSEYRHTGKVWHSPPFYYREGYKMCLAVYANGVGEGAGTHVSVGVLHFRGEYDDQLKWPTKDHSMHILTGLDNCDGYRNFLTCRLDQYPLINHVQIDCQHKFCNLNNKKILHMVNDCLTFQVEYGGCYLAVEIL